MWTKLSSVLKRGEAEPSTVVVPDVAQAEVTNEVRKAALFFCTIQV